MEMICGDSILRIEYSRNILIVYLKDGRIIEVSADSGIKDNYLFLNYGWFGDKK